RLRVHLGLYEDETSAVCHWHLPEAHFLESWSDVRAYDGTSTIIQPLIAPLYEGKTAHELLVALSDQPDRSAYEVLRGYWKSQWQAAEGTAPGADFERFWRRAVHDGVVPGTALNQKTVSLQPECLALPPSAPPAERSLEIVFKPDPTIFDGRFANNGWLQE